MRLRNRSRLISYSILGLFVLVLVYTQPVQKIVSDTDIRSTSYILKQQQPFFYYDFYIDILENHVNQEGHVDYAGLKNNENLDLYLYAIQHLPYENYLEYDKNEKTAFWINAYNAIALKIVSQEYLTLQAKENNQINASIKHIRGAFSGKKFDIMGKKYSLQDIADKIEKEFKEPKVQFALVPATKGAAPLRKEPYRGINLHVQLTEQARKFFSDRNKFQIDLNNGVVYISSLLKWHLKEFKGKYGNDQAYEYRTPEEQTLLNFIDNYLTTSDKAYIYSKNFKVDYLSYDWSLND